MNVEHKEVDLPQYKVNNLKKLADYLMSGDLKAEFDMSTYDDDSGTNVLVVNCGTVGCAVGHGPYAGIEKV